MKYKYVIPKRLVIEVTTVTCIINIVFYFCTAGIDKLAVRVRSTAEYLIQ